MLLLDTHVLLWTFGDSARLTENARQAISESDLCVSAASMWELAIKASLPKAEKRLRLDATISEIADLCAAQGIDLLPITPADCDRMRALPHIHEDPFDRIIIAQALERGIPLVTKDENIRKYAEVEAIW